jgi:hydroxymethylpyrimidine/phosphomethylpyrimidine kinase
VWFIFPRLKKLPTRGTGCALSSFIASQLALNITVEEAVKRGRQLFEDWLLKI